MSSINWGDPYLPAGADNHIDAPYNEKDPETYEAEIEISIIVRKKFKVEVLSEEYDISINEQRNEILDQIDYLPNLNDDWETDFETLEIEEV